MESLNAAIIELILIDAGMFEWDAEHRCSTSSYYIVININFPP